MIDPSFIPYGTINQFFEVQTEGASYISIGSQNRIPVYCFSEPTHWDYVAGMTALVIQDDGMLKRFYLDRPVTINAGVCFGFYPLKQDSTIAGDTTLLSKTNRIDFLEPFVATHNAYPLEIFTLFHQIGHDGLYFRGEQHLPLELVYLEKGELHNYCEGHDIVLHPTELLIFAPNQWHMQYSDKEVQFLTVSFSWDGHDFASLFNRVISTSDEIQQHIRALLKEHKQNLPSRDEFLNAQMKLLLLQILRSPESVVLRKKISPASESLHRQIIDKAIQYISEKIYGKLTVSDLAAAVNVSTSQLTSLFQTYLGVAPAKYITKIRLEESKILLGSKHMGVGEVASRLGYSSIQHFSKQFHAWFGTSPSSYIKKKNH